MHLKQKRMTATRSQECKLPSIGIGPTHESRARRKPRLNVKLNPMIDTIKMPNSVRSHVRQAKRNALPPIVEMADHKIGLPVT
mmetsp:Transcript_17202/g.38038  ORF Transcript_17202/g.38038 Transcript_17202/m.38038 type:complete len:83 (-) Transcript_17202:264-512(-)